MKKEKIKPKKTEEKEKNKIKGNFSFYFEGKEYIIEERKPSSKARKLFLQLLARDERNSKT
jgi:hypothetical protein